MASKPHPVPRKFDRLVEFDPRSKAFPIRALIGPKKPRSYSWSCGVWLDQGQEGACVGFGWSHEAAARPVCVPGINDVLARILYGRARELDDYPGEDYEGTSVLGGAKAAQEKGWMPEYRWGFGLDDVRDTVGHFGPVVLGIDWREGMDAVDANGFIHATGAVRGGHCLIARGVNVKLKYFLLRNSWGKSWGVNGDCKISFDDMDALLHAQGEACVPVKRAMGPKS